MKVVRASSEEEMVLAFLRAEYHSPRFKALIRRALGGTADLLHRPRLDDAAENRARKAALAAVRGYGDDNYLFRGFPSDVEWTLVSLTRDELGDLLYANYPTWVDLSGGTRAIRDGAKNVDRINVGEEANTNIKAVAREVASGRQYPPLIFAGESSTSGLVLVEGHTRATAYVLELPAEAEIEVIVGSSGAMRSWAFY